MKTLSWTDLEYDVAVPMPGTYALVSMQLFWLAPSFHASIHPPFDASREGASLLGRCAGAKEMKRVVKGISGYAAPGVNCHLLHHK